MNKEKIRKVEPVRLSKDQLRNSRNGTLGRFPSQDLYELEQNEGVNESKRSREMRSPSVEK